MPMTSSIWRRTFSGSAAGRSILLITGTMARLLFDRQVDVGQRLRLDPLGSVDHQHRALARGQRARHLVVEVDVPGRVDQVQLVGLAVGGLVGEPHGRRLDGDAALALEVHAVEELRLALPVGQRARRVEQAIGQGRLAVIDVGDDGEVADEAGRRGHEREGRRVAAALAPAGDVKRELPGEIVPFFFEHQIDPLADVLGDRDRVLAFKSLSCSFCSGVM